jgi:hypothetical protein
MDDLHHAARRTMECRTRLDNATTHRTDP